MATIDEALATLKVMPVLSKRPKPSPPPVKPKAMGPWMSNPGVELVIVRGQEIGDRGRSRPVYDEIGDVEDWTDSLYSEIGSRELARHVGEAGRVTEEDGKIVGEGDVGASHGSSLAPRRSRRVGAYRPRLRERKAMRKNDGQRKATIHSLPLYSVL